MADMAAHAGAVAGGQGAAAVAFFVPHLGGGGAEMNAVRLANELSRRGLRVYLLVARAGGPYEAQVARGVRIVHLGGSARGSSTLALLRAARGLRAWVARHRPDVLVPVMDLPAVAAITALAARRSPPVVVNVQNNPDAKIRQGWVLGLVLRAARILYPRARAVVALSQGVADTLARRVPGLSGRVHVIPNIGAAPDTPTLAAAPVAETPAPGRRLVVAAGRLVRQKNYPLLLEAMAALVSKVDAELWILGRGPLQAELEARAQALGLGDRVRFLGFRENPYAYMARADVFALSSSFEGFGNVLVEAMASGVPVVSTDCPHGPGEIIRDGVDGLLVPPGDAAVLAGALQRVLEDAQLAARLREAGRVRAREFDAARIAERWQAVFAGIAEPA